VHGPLPGTGALEYCTGTVPGPGGLGPERRFGAGARIAAGNWRPVPPDGPDGPGGFTAPAAEFRTGRGVALFPGPPGIGELIARWAVGGAGTGVEAAGRRARAIAREAMSALAPFAAGLSQEPLPAAPPYGIVVNHPDDPAVTIDPRSGERIGLHIDSWERLPPAGRDASSNRICLNLGREPRWLVFVPVPVAVLARQDEPRQRRLPAPELPGWYFAAHPDCTVLRLRVDPGWGYVAPTENMIHDGSTSGSTGTGAALFVRGRFRPPTDDMSAK